MFGKGVYVLLVCEQEMNSILGKHVNVMRAAQSEMLNTFGTAAHAPIVVNGETQNIIMHGIRYIDV